MGHSLSYSIPDADDNMVRQRGLVKIVCTGCAQYGSYNLFILAA